MRLLRILTCVGLVLVMASAGAQENRPKTMQEYQAMSDRAMASAMQRLNDDKARQASATPATAPLLQMKSLKATTSVDPAEIALRYQEMKSAALPPADELVVFVSSSLPLATLIKLASQAKQVGAIVVFRGINGDIRKRGEFARWVKYLEPMIKVNASVQVNPRLFTTYSVTSVPSFVLATREQDCNSDQCKISSSRIEGDVSLDYALEHWVSQGGRYGVLAQARLDRLTEGR